MYSIYNIITCIIFSGIALEIAKYVFNFHQFIWNWYQTSSKKNVKNLTTKFHLVTYSCHMHDI